MQKDMPSHFYIPAGSFYMPCLLQILVFVITDWKRIMCLSACFAVESFLGRSDFTNT